MTSFIRQLLISWDVAAISPMKFTVYNVTPRQGRHAVRRKLLRRLRERAATIQARQMEWSPK
jgi:hypothetical protein